MGEGLKCFYTNARSLRNKKDELFSYIIEENLDIVCITESWVNEKQFNETRGEYELEGYTIYLSQRTDRIGGGLIIYIRNTIPSRVNSDIKKDENVESLWVDISINKKSYKIGSFLPTTKSNY